ncbi:hypothetical protein IEE92_09555 [Kocuria sp. cx-116]|uniref:hypothetical protein n=1 Tax=Kocuria sp. cx-116 TaxID=2771378 RepID=UPI001686BB2E|nr:hypothetical protein [Kocuria sp. cx-116]MBD2762793.1 hypothetical protein [Kocuria sp. cx-116]
MGLRDLFRSKSTTSSTPQPSPGAPANDPRTQEQDSRAQGIQNQGIQNSGHSGQDAPMGTAPRGEATQDADGVTAADRADDRPAQDASEQQLPESGPLRNLVDIVLSRGADRARLTLVQSGNVMTHQTRQAHGDAQDEVENGTVDQGSPLFDDVADLYTQAMNTPAGPWRQLDLTVTPEQNGQRLVTVDYAFPSGQSRKESYVQGRALSGDDARRDGHGSEQLHPAGTETSVPDHGAHDERRENDIESVRVVDGSDSSPVADGQIVTKADPEPIVVAADDQAAHDQAHRQDPSPQDSVEAHEPAENRPAQEFQSADSDAAQGQRADRVAQGSVPDTRATETEAHAEHDAPRDERTDLPEHLDESEFGGLAEPESPVAPSGAGAAALAADDDPADAPQVAQTTDVAPSYTAPSEQPSGDSLATGNLVLTLADIQSRLSEAQRHLFGDGGTAREVSTVLIRVRALGTYYDALTHVRLNGFWDQRGTFDLVPENLLKVQELKDDSYVEGSGAPLAMMFRFRPGVPPEVSFDYSDEEAFVRYEQRLPGQNYLEELRMFPRTGSNIPQHMNDALQDWNY